VTNALSLGIDIGTSGVRAIAIDAAGAVRGQAGAAMPPATRDGDSMLQNAEIWWSAVVDTLARLAPLLPLEQVRAIGGRALGEECREGRIVHDEAVDQDPVRLDPDARRGGRVGPVEDGQRRQRLGGHGPTMGLARDSLAVTPVGGPVPRPRRPPAARPTRPSAAAIGGE